MSSHSVNQFACRLAILLSAMGAGCASGGGSNLPFNTATHRLLESTKQVRSAFPTPMPLARELDKGVLPAFYLEPGDTLVVQPANLDSPVRLSGEQVILPDGQIELGTYGRLHAAGKTPEEVEREVSELIQKQTKNAGPITVRLVGRQSKVFYVLGEVNSPGAYPLTGRETVLDAIVAAGGLTDAANRAGITYVQPTPPDGCRVALPVCYNEIVQLGDTSTNYQMAPGDRIYVPSMTFCQQLRQLFHKSADPGCPPCGMGQWPCPDVLPQHIPVRALPGVHQPELLPNAVIVQ